MSTAGEFWSSPVTFIIFIVLAVAADNMLPSDELDNDTRLFAGPPLQAGEFLSYPTLFLIFIVLAVAADVIVWRDQRHISRRPP